MSLHARKDRKALLSDSGNEDYDDEAPTSLDSNEKIAVLFIRPPQRNVRAMCACCKNDSEFNPVNLLEDLVSLCIVGGLKSKIDNFCIEHGKSHGSSKTYYAVCLGSYFLSVVCFVPLLIRDPIFRSFHFFFWIAISIVVTSLGEKAHRMSAKFMDSRRQFWHSWRESGMESELSAMLGRCGYIFEIESEELSWKLSLYKKKGGLQTSLPPPMPKEDEKDKAEQSVQEILKILEKVGTFEYRASDDTTPNPLDLWTISGILMGKILIHHKTSKATKRFAVAMVLFLVVFYAFYSPKLPLEFAFNFMMIIFSYIAAVSLFYTFVDMPKCRIAMEGFCRELSTLIQDRHDGYSLRYEIDRKKNSYHSRAGGRIVLEPPENGDICKC